MGWTRTSDKVRVRHNSEHEPRTLGPVQVRTVFAMFANRTVASLLVIVYSSTLHSQHLCGTTWNHVDFFHAFPHQVSSLLFGREEHWKFHMVLVLPRLGSGTGAVNMALAPEPPRFRRLKNGSELPRAIRAVLWLPNYTVQGLGWVTLSWPWPAAQ